MAQIDSQDTLLGNDLWQMLRDEATQVFGTSKREVQAVTLSLALVFLKRSKLDPVRGSHDWSAGKIQRDVSTGSAKTVQSLRLCPIPLRLLAFPSGYRKLRSGSEQIPLFVCSRGLAADLRLRDMSASPITQDGA